MPVNITDIQDFILLATKKQQKLVKEGVEQFYKPLQTAAMAMQLKAMPPEVIKQLEKQNPTAMKAIREKIKENGGLK